VVEVIVTRTPLPGASTSRSVAPVSINIALPVGRIGRGSGVITIECLRKGDERYRVVVADDGAGLPQGVVSSVLDKIGALMVQTPIHFTISSDGPSDRIPNCRRRTSF
jgi:hypothetical protein